MRSKLFVATTVLVITSAALSDAQSVRYYEEGGTTYRETRKTTRRPVSETRLEPRQRTVHREQLTTEWLESYQTHLTPVTEYRWESHWVGRWNPLRTPALVHQIVPRTRWELRTSKVSTPYTRRDWIPGTQTVHVPVTTMRMAEEEVITRVAVDDRAGGDPFVSGSRVANRSIAIGGVGRLDNDPPRRGDSSTWRASSGASVRR